MSKPSFDKVARGWSKCSPSVDKLTASKGLAEVWGRLHYQSHERLLVAFSAIFHDERSRCSCLLVLKGAAWFVTLIEHSQDVTASGDDLIIIVWHLDGLFSWVLGSPFEHFCSQPSRNCRGCSGIGCPAK